MGKRIYLRPLSKEDAPLLTVWINDPEVNQFLTVSTPMSLEDELQFVESRGKKKDTDVVFVIVLVENNEAIGVMGIHNIDHKNGTATTGSFIGRKDLWSQGYGTEAKMLVLEYAFNTLNLRKVRSYVFDFNLRSKRCLEKCGYHMEGIQKQEFFHNGRYCDRINMVVFRDDFLPLWETLKELFVQ